MGSRAGRVTCPGQLKESVAKLLMETKTSDCPASVSTTRPAFPGIFALGATMTHGKTYQEGWIFSIKLLQLPSGGQRAGGISPAVFICLILQFHEIFSFPFS